LAICETDGASLSPADGHIPAQDALRGFHSAEFCVDASSEVGDLLTFMGFVTQTREGETQRFELPSIGPASIIDVHYKAGGEKAQEDAGSVHHIAFAVKDDEAQQRVRQALIAYGCQVTDVKDRSYFKAIYFRTQDGILFEVATNRPGFATDEPLETMGETLCLPEQHKGLRDKLESQLIPL
ncbi:MAG: VOC family protein, partial [Paracoccaceae bacterium]